MQNIFRRWFSFSAGDDGETNRRVVLINAINLALLLFAALGLAGALLGGRPPLIVLILEGLAVAGAAVAHWLTRGRRLRLAGGWLIGAGFSLVAGLTISQGTTRSPVTAALALFVGVAGMLIGTRGIVATALAGVLLVSGLMLAENAGRLPPSGQAVTLAQWAAYLVLFGAAGGLTYLARQQLRQSLKRCKTEMELRRRAEAELRSSQERFQSLFEQTHDAVFMIDLSGHYLAANQRAVDLFGYTADEFRALSVGDTSAEPEESQSIMDRLEAGERVPLYERRFRKKDGQVFPAEVNAGLIRDSHGRPMYVQSALRDISERKQAEAALRESEAKYRIVADNTYDWEFWEDPAGGYIYISPSCSVISGYEAEEFRADPALSDRIVHSDDAGIVQRHLEALQAHQKDQIDCRIVRKDGEVRWVSHICVPIYDESGVYLGNRGSNRDITQRKEAEEALLQANEQLNQRVQEVERLQAELREQALRDPLTGLYNRRYLNEALPRLLLQAERERAPLSLLVGDIDHFKEINDTYGHQLGDRFLAEIARMIIRCTRGMDIVCRFGGEEFLLVLPGASLASARKRAEEIRQKCAELSIQHETKDLRVTISLGVAGYPAHSKDPEQIIIKADKALYISKKHGRNRVTVWKEPSEV